MLTRLVFALPLVGAVLALAAPAAAQKDDGKLRFELYQDKKAEYRWRLTAVDGPVLATGGQGYKAKADAKNGVESVRKAAAGGKGTFEVYEDAGRKYRWRLKASNGQVVAGSGEAFAGKAEAEGAVGRVRAGAAKAEVVEVKDGGKEGK